MEGGERPRICLTEADLRVPGPQGPARARALAGDMGPFEKGDDSSAGGVDKLILDSMAGSDPGKRKKFQGNLVKVNPK